MTSTVPEDFRHRLRTFGPIGQPAGLFPTPVLYAFRGDGSTRRIHHVDDAWDRHPAYPHHVIDALALAITATGDIPRDLDGIPIDTVIAVAVYLEHPGDPTMRRMLVGHDNDDTCTVVVRHGDDPPISIDPDLDDEPWDAVKYALATLITYWPQSQRTDTTGERAGADRILDFSWDPPRSDPEPGPKTLQAITATAVHLHAAITASRTRPDSASIATAPVRDHLSRLADAHPAAFDDIQEILTGLGLPPLERTYVVRIAVPLEFTTPATSPDEARIQACNALSSLAASGDLVGAYVDWPHLDWLTATVRPR